MVHVFICFVLQVLVVLCIFYAKMKKKCDYDRYDMMVFYSFFCPPADGEK